MKRSSIQQLKLRTRCARCRKLGHWALECPEGNRGQRNDERYDRRATRSGENSKGFISLAKPTERRPSFLGASWTFVTLDPGEVLWDTGAQEGLVGKQQFVKWCTLLAEHGLHVEWSQEKPESASGIGGMTKPIGVVYVPVGLAGCNGIIRFTVVEQDVPPLLPVEMTRTLQASLDLTDDGDKVIFRQFGGESSMRTLQSGHTVIRADQFDPDGWQLPEVTELCQDNDEGCATNYMSVIAHAYQRPRCRDNDTSAGDHDPASTSSCRPRQKTTSNDDHERDIWTSSQRYQSWRGSTAWKTVDDQTVETTRTLHGVRAMRGIPRHPVSGISDVDPHGTIGGHPACIATTRAMRDEGQEEQCCESSGGSVGARQSLTERQPGNRRTIAIIHRLRSRRERCEVCGNHSPDHGSTGSRDEAEQSHSARVHREPVEIERPFVRTDTGA